jgi:hypothetical protein
VAGLDSSMGSAANAATAHSPRLGRWSATPSHVLEAEKGLQIFLIALFAVLHCAACADWVFLPFSPPEFFSCLLQGFFNNFVLFALLFIFDLALLDGLIKSFHIFVRHHGLFSDRVV